MPNIHLIDASLSPFANKVKIVLAEKNLPFTRHTVGSAPPEIRHLLSLVSPRSEVPLLIDIPSNNNNSQPVILHDSTVICEYLDDAYPEHPMRPATAALKAKARIIDDAMDTHVEGVTWALNEIYAFNRAGPSGSALRTELVEKARKEIGEWYEWLELLLDDGEFLCGKEFTVADAGACSVVMGIVGYRMVPKRGGKVERWWERCKARESVKGVLEANAREVLTMKSAVGSFTKGSFKRQYRDHRLEFFIRNGGLSIVQDGLEKDNVRFSQPGEFVKVARNLKGGKVWEGVGKLGKL